MNIWQNIVCFIIFYEAEKSIYKMISRSLIFKFVDLSVQTGGQHLFTLFSKFENTPLPHTYEINVYEFSLDFLRTYFDTLLVSKYLLWGGSRIRKGARISLVYVGQPLWANSFTYFSTSPCTGDLLLAWVTYTWTSETSGLYINAACGRTHRKILQV
jgi:hypothetical protein